MNSTRPIRVLLCDDHNLVRAGLRSLLEREPDVEVVGEASRGEEALGLVASLQPDIALVDIGMPGVNGFQLTAMLSQQFPEVRVLIVSVHRSAAYVRQAMADGAKGYLLKDAGAADLRDAIRVVARGETYVSPQAMRGRETRPVDHPAGTNHELSPRQREILQLIAMGHTTKEIAVRLDLSVKTVETHRTELMRRLDIHDVAGLVRYAIRTGLVTAET
jgi:DNA-binding NarL/FixJ family response regulator